MKNVYAQNCKTWVKEIEEETYEWKVSHVYGLKELMVKCSHYSTVCMDSMWSLTNFQWHFPQIQKKKFQNSYGFTNDSY